MGPVNPKYPAAPTDNPKIIMKIRGQSKVYLQTNLKAYRNYIQLESFLSDYRSKGLGLMFKIIRYAN